MNENREKLLEISVKITEAVLPANILPTETEEHFYKRVAKQSTALAFALMKETQEYF